jgi:hypothetical protein
LRQSIGDLQRLNEPAAGTIDLYDDQVGACFFGGIQLAKHILLEPWTDYADKIDDNAVFVFDGLFGLTDVADEKCRGNGSTASKRWRK